MPTHIYDIKSQSYDLLCYNYESLSNDFVNVDFL